MSYVFAVVEDGRRPLEVAPHHRPRRHQRQRVQRPGVTPCHYPELTPILRFRFRRRIWLFLDNQYHWHMSWIRGFDNFDDDLTSFYEL